MDAISKPRAIVSGGLNSRGTGAILIVGGIAAFLSVGGSVVDIIIGSISGGNIAALPQTAAGRFEQLISTPMLGLYNLDLLNLATTLLGLPAIYAAWLILRKTGSHVAGLALTVAALGVAVFVANNPALPMLGLSGQYAHAIDEPRRALLAAAGEAVLARGAHGSPGVLPSFVLPLLANTLLSCAMIRSIFFPRIAAWLGLAGNALLLAYIAFVTFAPAVKESAAAFAAPGGLMAIGWMILLGLGLLSRKAKDTLNAS